MLKNKEIGRGREGRRLRGCQGEIVPPSEGSLVWGFEWTVLLVDHV
jgi:hypothetical protein